MNLQPYKGLTRKIKVPPTHRNKLVKNNEFPPPKEFLEQYRGICKKIEIPKDLH